MCEFCTEHSEGRKWYLEMQNYSAELLNAMLTGRELALAGTETRLGWVRRFWRSFICFGCGVCMVACPTDAIKPLPRQEHAKARDIWLQPAQ